MSLAFKSILFRTTPRFHKKHMRSPRLGVITWVYVGSAIVLGYFAPQINQWLFPWLISPLDKSSISVILSAIAAGMITLTGIVFSLVFVIVQFGSSTYSPRITRIFAHVRVLRHSLGIFTGTFVYSLLALRTIGVTEAKDVSAFTVWLAFAWLLGSIVILANLVRVFTTLTIGNVLFVLGAAGQASIARTYLPIGDKEETDSSEATVEHHQMPVTQTVTYEGEPGYVIRYERASLVTLARTTDTVIHLLYGVGDALRDGEAVAVIRGGRYIPEDQIYAAIVLGRERAFRDDPRYALRLLVDMAIRALSPTINDPTTAVQALDHIEMLLHRLGNADLNTGHVRDDDGAVRLIYKSPTWEDFMQLGLSEIMQYGATSLQIQRRLAALLPFLRQSLPPSRAKTIDRFTQERQALVFNVFGDETLRHWANTPDPGGIGGGR